jgi:hypothetical protein
VQVSPVFALTVTVPPGIVMFVDPVTLTLIATGWPGIAGLGVAAVIVVVVVALFTTSVTAPAALT